MANGTWRIARNRSGAQIPLIIAGIFAVLLLIAGKLHFVLFERARAALSDRTAPLLQSLNTPVVGATRWLSGIGHFFDVYSENQRLREENARLLQWRGAALAFQDRVNHYQRLLKTVPEPSYSAVTARVIARSSQPFLETVVLNAGRENGVKAGQAVVDARGMLGRIYVAGQHTAWVVVLDDSNSRIPVQIRPGNVQGILTGNNASEPTLEALPPRTQLKNDAEVVTSGDGGLLPPGLPVGTVVVSGKEPKVALYADPASAEDVRILNFTAPVETMPKPLDQDLPVPAKLEPPAAASVAGEVVAKSVPPKSAPTRPTVHIISVPRTSSASSLPARAKPTHAGIETNSDSTDQEPVREPPPDDQTGDQDNQ